MQTQDDLTPEQRVAAATTSDQQVGAEEEPGRERRGTPTQEPASPEPTSQTSEGPTSRERGPTSTAEVAQRLEGEGASERAAEEEQPQPLLADDEADRFRGHWESIQAGFVDEPQRAVRDADALVAEVMQRLADTFARERSSLEEQWDRGDQVSTEDLRVALQRYRSFFQRLMAT
jgi:hypothetical protein